MRILVTPTFERAVKKLHRQQKAELDAAVNDLAGIRVFKFRLANQLCLLSYRVIDEGTIKLLTVGPHENFYLDLKRLDH